MNPAVAYTAIVALSALAIIPWALIAAGKLRTPGPARKAAGEVRAAAETPPKATASQHPNSWQSRGRDPHTGQFLPASVPLREAGRAS